MSLSVQSVIERALPGVELRQWYPTGDSDGVTGETVSVVVWRRPNLGPKNGVGFPTTYEWGTHRVVLNYELDEGACMWGHYFNSDDAAHEAYVDYLKRIREET